MQTNSQLRLTLIPAPGQDQIAGVLVDETGGGHPFSSWLTLLSLLEAARSRTSNPDSTSRPAVPNPAPHHTAVA